MTLIDIVTQFSVIFCLIFRLALVKIQSIS